MDFFFFPFHRVALSGYHFLFFWEGVRYTNHTDHCFIKPTTLRGKKTTMIGAPASTAAHLGHTWYHNYIVYICFTGKYVSCEFDKFGVGRYAYSIFASCVIHRPLSFNAYSPLNICIFMTITMDVARVNINDKMV